MPHEIDHLPSFSNAPTNPAYTARPSPDCPSCKMLWKVRTRTFDIGRRPLLMGVLNVTPDSFSDGGRWWDAAAAVQQGLHLLEAGADILDVGGESSRPGAAAVAEEEELRRVLPVIKALSAKTTACISIDTYKPAVAAAALGSGADIVNDITGLQNPEMRRVIKETGAGAVAMHMQGTPANMQKAPQYVNVVEEVLAFLNDRLMQCVGEGIASEALALDPGIGFGKTQAHNLELIRSIERFQESGRPVVLGVSRKSFLQSIAGEREWATVALSSYAASRGVGVLRVHDVQANLRAVEVTHSLLEDCA